VVERRQKLAKQSTCKKLIEAAYMYARLTKSGVLKGFVKQGTSELNEPQLLYLEKQK
jgi:hypothetical protein